MPWTSFEALNREREASEEPLFANPRNAASGTLKSKQTSVVARRKLDAYLYSLLKVTTSTCSKHALGGSKLVMPCGKCARWRRYMTS